jgi:hypothetical protein
MRHESLQAGLGLRRAEVSGESRKTREAETQSD